MLDVGLQSHAQILTQIGQNFTASTLYVDSSALPPDPNGAVGPQHFVEFINGRFSVFNKVDGSKIKTMPDVNFWIQAGVTLASGWDVTDPRIIYDAAAQRWFASQVDFDSSGLINTNRFLLAISATVDPTGAWQAVAIPSDLGGNNSADFPTLGLDGQGVYLSAAMYDTNSMEVGPTLVSIPKAGLLANPPVASGLTRFGILSYANRGYILQPAICVDGSGQGSVLAAGGFGFDQKGNSVTNTTLVNFLVQNPAGPGLATLSGSTLLTVPPYTGPLDPTQPDGTANLDDGDSRISAKVHEVRGVLYAVHGTEVNNLAALRWYRINAATQTVLESGTITDPVLDLFYPSISANASGTVVIAYDSSSISTFVSSFAVVGQTINGVTTFGQPLLLKSGTASYQSTNSFGISRWGDYSATCVDPADPNRFWTIQEFPSGPDIWSTQVTELLTAFPKLTIARPSNNLLLSWPGTAIAFNLEAADHLAVPNWTSVAQNLATNNGVVTAQVPVTTSARFFRLNKL